MPVELTILAWGMILLLVHIFAAAHVKTKQYGPKWNMGARDETLPPLNAVAGRTSEWTALGGWIWLAARVIYLPLYGFGIPVVRTIIFLSGLVGLLMTLWPLLRI